jgi:hypothetical protein
VRTERRNLIVLRAPARLPIRLPPVLVLLERARRRGSLLRCRASCGESLETLCRSTSERANLADALRLQPARAGDRLAETRTNYEKHEQTSLWRGACAGDDMGTGRTRAGFGHHLSFQLTSFEAGPTPAQSKRLQLCEQRYKYSRLDQPTSNTSEETMNSTRAQQSRCCPSFRREIDQSAQNTCGHATPCAAKLVGDSATFDAGHPTRCRTRTDIFPIGRQAASQK